MIFQSPIKSKQDLWISQRRGKITFSSLTLPWFSKFEYEDFKDLVLLKILTRFSNQTSRPPTHPSIMYHGVLRACFTKANNKDAHSSTANGLIKYEPANSMD